MTELRGLAIVTGAAGGIGQAIARQLAAQKLDLALIDVDADGLESLVCELELQGARCQGLAGDLVDLEFLEACVDQIVDRWNRIDLLVNNAAWRELVGMDQISVESWQRTIGVCLTAPAFLSRWVADVMRRQQKGVIVNVSSIMAQRGGGVSPAYVAAKGGLNALTYELAALYGPSGIRVFGVAPGAVDTALSQDYTSRDGSSLTRDMRIWSEDHIPLGRWSSPCDIASAIAALAGDAFAYLHGTIVELDGGWSHCHFPKSLRQRTMQES